MARGSGSRPGTSGEAPQSLPNLVSNIRRSSDLLGAKETICTWGKSEEVKENASGKKIVDYSRLCLHCRLEEENVVTGEDGSETDLTFEKLLQYEKLGYIFKDALFLWAGRHDWRLESTTWFAHPYPPANSTELHTG